MTSLHNPGLTKSRADTLYAPITSGPIVPPIDSQFSWLNQGTAAVDATGPGIGMTLQNDITNVLRLRIKPVISQKFTVSGLLENNVFIGSTLDGSYLTGPVLGLYDSGSSKLALLFFGYNLGSCFYYGHWSDPNTFNDLTKYATGHFISPQSLWLQMQLDDTNITVNYSFNGIDYQLWWQEAKNTYLPAITHYFWGGTNTNTPTAIIRLISWEEVDNT